MIYLDNGATSFRKPPGVYRAVERAMYTCANPGRGGYGAAMEASETVYACREAADHQLHPRTEYRHPLRREARGTGDRVRI